MGQPDDFHQTSDRRRDRVSRSSASKSSEESFLLQAASKEESSSRNTSSSSQSQDTDFSLRVQLPSKRQHHEPPPTQAGHCQHCLRWSGLNKQDHYREVIKNVFERPDSTHWQTAIRTVKLERDDKGSLGIRYCTVKGEDSGTVYTLVNKVFRGGPASGKIRQGDWILSANGQPLDSEKGNTLRSVVSANKNDPVCLIIQRPEGINCRETSGQSPRLQRSVSQERRKGEEEAKGPHKPVERMDSSKMSTNSSHTSDSSSDKSDIRPKTLEDRLQALVNSGNNSRLDTLMPRLPCLRILIAGCQAETLAVSLLKGVGEAQPLASDIGMHYRACVKKTGSELSLGASHEDSKEWIMELLESVADESNLKPDALSDRVQLELIATKSHPFSTYCQHVLATAHSIFVIQFCCQDFLTDKQSVLRDIQTRLNKIRTYASSRAPVYLVATTDHCLPVEQLTAIGQSLHQHFAKAFMNQLQYDPTTNCPCFQIVRTNPGELLNKAFTDLSLGVNLESDFETEQCRIVSSKNCSTLDVCYSVGSNPASSGIHPRDRGFEVGKLRDRILRMAFEQPFIVDRYPYKYLLHRERVQRLKENSPHYAFKAGIKGECGRNTSEKDLRSLLYFLHHSGDIIYADFLEYRTSSSNLFKIASNNVLLDRRHLIEAAKQLTTVPSLSDQQDSHFRDSMQHWQDLGQKSVASSAFLEHLLRHDPKSDPENLLTTLGLMGLVHCLQNPDAPSATIPTTNTYLVPFFLPHEVPSPYPQPRNSSGQSYQLCLDFHGSIPHGFFLALLVRLLAKVRETHGRWSIDGPSSARLSFANDCEMDIVCDELQSIITISARCSVTYKLLDLLGAITNIVDDLRSVKSDLQITVGPPCPLHPHHCEVRAGEPGKTHVIDVAGGKVPVPLWCGDQQLDLYPEVDQWLLKPADIMQVSLLPSHNPIQVSLRTHVKKWPPALFNWLCNQLNAPPVGRDWQGLAGVLGYNVGDVRIFKLQRQSVFDPCCSLLLDWGRHADSTLEALVRLLHGKPMERLDILTDLQEKWRIVQ
ncbi:uncharacterized protein LOC119737261 [Patiria miniata]|uniref:Uncharacterized protein n=1 Tax=Patiria miniata TaxID=46514 RepID=A0A914AUP0_PATMI|nr:uncharacterized protein LOC119737261 [Patiria miniata]XP_038067388.1 uncharacterized protein LOC119737261 [Patiria miniata]